MRYNIGMGASHHAQHNLQAHHQMDLTSHP
jgi:hypothetical protein